jgi:hypothetical protein
MGCQSSYSCPITIPTGSNGAAGAAGADGANGVALYINTTGTSYTSSTPGDQLLKTSTLTAAAAVAGDVIDIEAIFTTNSTYSGTIYITFGGSTVATYSFLGTTNAPIFGSVAYVRLKSKLYVIANTNEYFVPQVELFGNPTTQINVVPSNISVNVTNAVSVDAKANITAGTATLVSLILTVNKKV